MEFFMSTLFIEKPKKRLPKNQTFDSQDTKPRDCLDALFIISNNYEGRLLQMRNYA